MRGHPPSEPEGAPPPTSPHADPSVPQEPPTGRTGITLGILVIVLLALLFYFYWRSTGARDESGLRPPPMRDG